MITATIDQVAARTTGSTNRAAKALAGKVGKEAADLVVTFHLIDATNHTIEGVLAVTPTKIGWAGSANVFLTAANTTPRTRPHQVDVIEKHGSDVVLAIAGISGAPMHFETADAAVLFHELTGTTITKTEEPTPIPAPRSVPAGWYSDGVVQRYWDGAAWTDHTAPVPPAP